MSETTRPELGTVPYYIHAEDRIRDLGEAIARNAHLARMNTQRDKIIEWAREITLQIATIETLEQPKITLEEMDRIYEALKKPTPEIMTEEEWRRKNGFERTDTVTPYKTTAENDWCNIPAEEMTKEQAQKAVKELRNSLLIARTEEGHG